jgi:hypothetical protein
MGGAAVGGSGGAATSGAPAKGGAPASGGASAAGAPTIAGAGGAGPVVDPWEQLEWDAPREELVTYLWTASSTDTWAVLFGSDGRGSFYRDHWDGSSWTRTLDPTGNTGPFTDRQIWSAPNERAFACSIGTLQRWFGKNWLNWEATPDCRAIGGTAEDDIWCSNGAQLWHFDGKQWLPWMALDVQGILALARDDVWAWGSQGAMHFDGSSWKADLQDSVRSISANASNDVWAVQDGNLVHSDGPGTSWRRQNPSGSQIADVWSQSKTNTWIVAAGAAMRWNGSAWETVALPAQDELLLISGSDKDVWIAGTLKLLHGRVSGR